MLGFVFSLKPMFGIFERSLFYAHIWFSTVFAVGKTIFQSSGVLYCMVLCIDSFSWGRFRETFPKSLFVCIGLNS